MTWPPAWPWSLPDLLATALFALGLLFFLGGTAGLLRFADVFSRIHALTKADNAGLGCIAVATMLLTESWWDVPKIALVWLVVLAGSAASGYLMAGHARRSSRDESDS